MEQALVRELHEEIGVLPTAWQELAVLRVPDGAEVTAQLHVYAVTAWEGIPCNLQLEEHDQIAWFAVEDARRLSLAHPDYPDVFARITHDSRDTAS